MLHHVFFLIQSFFSPPSVLYYTTYGIRGKPNLRGCLRFGGNYRESLVKNSLLMAIHKRKPGAGLIHHSDRGSQYCAYEYQKLLKFFNIIPSMSLKG